jgi:hypothetical protein
MVHGFLNK